MKLYYKNNGITSASSRKREEEKYKLVHYMSEKKSSTDNSRTKLLTGSKLLKDGFYNKFNNNNILSVKYHCSCYHPPLKTIHLVMEQKMILSREQNVEKVKITHLKIV